MPRGTKKLKKTPLVTWILSIYKDIWVSQHTKGSGDPSSGCIWNTAGPQVRVIQSYSARLNVIGYESCGLFSTVAQAGSYLSQTEQWWHRSGFSNWQRSQKRIAEETQAGQSRSRQQRPPPYTWPQTNKLMRVKWALRAASLSWPRIRGKCAPYCTSGVGAGVDGQILGYPPQDLLLRLPPIFTLQQLFVGVRQVKLCGAKARELPFINSSICQRCCLLLMN